MVSTIACFFSTSVALAQKAGLFRSLIAARGWRRDSYPHCFEVLQLLILVTTRAPCIRSPKNLSEDTLIKYAWLWNIVKHRHWIYIYIYTYMCIYLYIFIFIYIYIYIPHFSFLSISLPFQRSCCFLQPHHHPALDLARLMRSCGVANRRLIERGNR